MTTNTPTPARRARRVAIGIAGASTLAAVGLPASAGAGTYGVVQCGDVYQQGQPARNGIYPYSTGADGFKVLRVGSPGGGTTNCTPGSPLRYGTTLGMSADLTSDQGTHGSGDLAGYQWLAPSGTVIKRYAMRFQDQADTTRTFTGPSGQVAITHEGQTDPTYDYRTFSTPFTDGRQLDVDIPAGAGSINWFASCRNGNCPGGGPTVLAMINVQGFTASLSDDSNPQASNVSGDLASSSTWRGTMGLSANLTDKGSGVYRLIFQRRADNGTFSDVDEQIIDTNGGKCVPVGDYKVFTETRAFAYAQPCKLDASGDFDVNTTKLPQGTGTYRLLAEDASGNRTTVIGAAQRTVNQNPNTPTTPPGSTTVIVTNPTPAAATPPPTVIVTPPPAQVITPITAGGVPRTAGSAALLQCTKNKLALTEVLPSGRRDLVRGVADASFVGQKVSIKYVATGETVARATIGVDGTFSTSVRAPRGRTARSNLGRYTAAINRSSSAALKRIRRMYTSTAYRTAGGGVYVSGRVTKPFPKGSKVTVQVRKTCGSWRTAKSGRITSSGAFGITIPVAGGPDAVVVRVQGTVKKTARSKRTSRTYTLPTAIQLR